MTQYSIILIYVYYRDNVPTVHLGIWDLNATMFDGEEAAGPVPTLFAEDSEATLGAIRADRAKTHADFQKIVKIFFVPECVNIKEAAALLKKPREGAVTYPFKRGKISNTPADSDSQGQRAKRARLEEGVTETGT